MSIFTVSAKSEAGRTDITVWHIESPAAKITAEPTTKLPALRQITYGNAPAGYVTIVSPHPLAWDKTYRVTSSLKVEGDDAVVGAGGEFTPTKP